MDAIQKHLGQNDDGSNVRDLASPPIFLSIRFALSFALMPLLFLFVREPKRTITRRAEFGFALALATVFTGSFYLQVYGLRLVFPSVSAFITSLYVIFTPFFVWMLQRRRPAKAVALAIPIAFLGVAIISFEPGISLLAMLLSPGVLLSFGCAVGFAFHIAMTDVATRKVAPLRLSVVMLGLSAVFAAILIPFVIPMGEFWRLLPILLTDWDFLGPTLVTTIFATVIAVYAWNRWQKDIGPARAAVLYTMEPVFASLISIGMGKEHWRWLLVVGGLLVILANVGCELAELRRGRLQKS